ncbi:hypothetical protein T01_15206, partial [Trichinella spiralis]
LCLKCSNGKYFRYERNESKKKRIAAVEEAEKSLRRRDDHETSIQQPAYAQFYNKNVTRLRPTASLANSPQATRLAYFHRITTEGEPNVEIWHQVLLKCSVQLFLTFLSLTLLQMGATLFSAGRFFCGLMMTLAISVSYEHRCHRMEHIEEQYDGPSMILFACWSTAV